MHQMEDDEINLIPEHLRHYLHKKKHLTERAQWSIHNK